jgi:hypothetical protein
MYAAHPNIHIFDHPRTFSLQIRGITLALAGFPFVRYGIRKDFKNILGQTGWHRSTADGYLLCLHQCLEGARVGPVDFTFCYQPDVIKARDIPDGFVAVLAGHIHEEARPILSAASLRSLAPPTLNVSVYWVDDRRHPKAKPPIIHS